MKTENAPCQLKSFIGQAQGWKIPTMTSRMQIVFRSDSPFGVMDLLFLVSSEVATTSKMKIGCCKKFDNNKSCSGHN